MGELGVDAGDDQQVLLAGSFGAYLTPLSAVRIGLVPRIALPRIVSAGNVAGEGAKIAALSVRERAEAHSILREVEYVELSGRTDFNDLFIDQLAFPDEDGRRTAVACGALALDVRAIARRRGWDLEVIPCRRCCTTGPTGSDALASPRCAPPHDVVAVAYGDCGTYGALDG